MSARPAYWAMLMITVLFALGALVGCGGGGDENEVATTDCGPDGYLSPKGECFPHSR